MNKQPEALRLADAIEKGIQTFFPDFEPIYNAPAELRRLHEVNQELLEALRKAKEFGTFEQGSGVLHDMNAAIAKATGETK